MLDLPKLKIDLNAPEKFGNVAEMLDVQDRRKLAPELMQLIAVDENSMSEWAGRAQGYLDQVDAEDARTVATNKEQEGSDEEPPPSTEMTLAAVIQFSARATGALLGEPDLAKASEPGGEPLAAWVSSQLRTADPNWTLDTDPLVVHLAVTGLAWRKRTFDEYDRVFHSYFVPSVGSNSVIINSNVRSVERAPRITHQFERYPYEIERSISRKHWVDYEPVYDETDPQAPKRFYEMDAWLDLDGDLIEEPWTVVISRDDMPEIVKIIPRWSKKTIVDDRKKDVLFFNPIRRFYAYRFLPDPKGGFFPTGFGKLLSRMEGSADRLLSSIVDTAETESENGGVYTGEGVGLPDKVEVKGNRVTKIPSDGRPLNDVWSPFPAKTVSAGSVAVFDKLTTLGDRLAGTLNVLDNAPASMSATMAKGLIDNGTQVQSAVHRRLVASMTQEFRMFVKMADAYDMLPPEAVGVDKNNVSVTADPQLATEMQRSALAGVYMEMIEQAAAGVPWNMQVLQARVSMVMRLPDPEKLIGQPRAPEATPDEKMKGMLGLMKQKTENMKVTGAVAVQLTQALKNMVEASGGMLDNRQALLMMAQLEDAVQRMIADGGISETGGPGGMAGQPGNGAAGALPPPEAGANGQDISAGQPGGPGAAGAGSGLS
jgi:hypothetical protein